MPKIKIDLNDLTQAHLDECRAHLGHNEYAAPCIIGTLLPKELREDPEFPQLSGINGNRMVKYVTVIPEQLEDLIQIQDNFDSSDWDGVLEIASKYAKESLS